MGARMSGERSLTDAVKLTAGISLTQAVKDAAGSRDWFVDDLFDAQKDSTQATVGRQARRVLAACARVAVLAVLTFAFLHTTSSPTGLDAEPRSIAPAQRRVALVVGNSGYRNTPRLENPKNDAADVSAALKKLDFQVVEGFDLDKAAFDAIVREFAAALKGADVGLFFYAGHGMQVSARNYLVPVDAKLTTVSALDIEMVRLDLIHQTMVQEAATNLLFFDACRNNPLSRNLAGAMGTRSIEIGRGLAAVESGAGTLISFSTQPGNVALDGTGRNSPFSGALVRQLQEGKEDLNAVLIAVRNDVMRQTNRQQVPWEHSALTRRFYFHLATPAFVATPATQLRLSEAAEAWSATKDTASFDLLDAFVARYGDTFFAELARARIGDLTKGLPPSSPTLLEDGATPRSAN
jgi:uncharacterized caspase-like protein